MKSAPIEQNTLHLLQLRYGIIGTSVPMRRAIERLVQVAPTDLTALITGETGTGKEIFANAIHGLSKRKKYPFVSVNCGAIPETLLESELFGHEKGAFTGAVEQRKGFFETAHLGTIFLDEIGEMPIATQVKLLRVLESGEFSRVGSSTVLKVDVRLVAATNRDLEYEVRRGNFRQDLFFRLNSVHIILPPLRQHTDDIPILVESFAQRCCEKNNVHFEGISEDALEVLQKLPWHGNVRELRNTIETIVTLEQGEFITPEMLRRYITPTLPPPTEGRETAIVHVPNAERNEPDLNVIYRSLLEMRHDITDVKNVLKAMIEGLPNMQFTNFVQEEKTEEPQPETKVEETTHRIILEDDFRLEEAERKLIIASLKRFDGNRRMASSALGISERTLYRKLGEYNLTELF
ncbi:MAG: sigma-54 dependent transcriptional regulator [Bacteroidota bacterium]